MYQVLEVGCGSNYLFRLTRQGAGAAADSAGTALGKLEIKWRGSLGEVGRLQTQQILGPPAPTKVSIDIVGDAVGHPVNHFGSLLALLPCMLECADSRYVRGEKKKRKYYYTFQRQFDEKPTIIPCCPVMLARYNSCPFVVCPELHV